MTQQVGNEAAEYPEDHPFRVLGGDAFPQTLGDPEPAAAESAPAEPAAPVVDPEVERLRATTTSQQQIIDRLLDRALAVPVQQTASAPEPRAAREPAPMPDPTTEPEAFARWIEGTVESRASEIAGRAVGAVRGEISERDTLAGLWAQIQAEEPDLAKNADLFGLVWQAEGGRLNGRDPELVKQRVVSRVRGIVGGTSAAPAAAVPAAQAAAPASRTQGLSGPGVAPRAAAAPSGPTEDRGMIGDIEEIQKNSGYY